MKSEDKALLRAIRGKHAERPPFWLMRQAGRYLPEYKEVRSKAGSFMSLCLNPELATEVTLQPIRRFGFDAAILFSDILIVPYGLGQSVTFKEGEGPALDPIRSLAAVTKLNRNGFRSRVAKVYEAVGLIRNELPISTSFIGFAGAPWTVATYMIEGGSSRTFSQAHHWLNNDPDGFQTLIDLLVEVTIDHLDQQIQNGVEVVQLFDSWAGALQDRDYDRWVIEPTQRLVKGLKALHPNVPIIGFPKGSGSRYLGYTRETGVDVIAIDHDLPLVFGRDVLKPLAAIQGNLDPLLLVAGGTAMERRVAEILAAFAGSGGKFIFNLGHGILPQTPPENVAALAKLLGR